MLLFSLLVYAAMSSLRRQRSRSPMPALHADCRVAPDGVGRGSSAVRGLSSSSTLHAGDGSAALAVFEAESSDCSISELGFDSLCSSVSDSRLNDGVGPGELLWDSPLSSPRSDGYLCFDEPAGSMRSSSELLGHGTLRESLVPPAGMAADGRFGCICCRSDSALACLRQHLWSGGRSLGRQLSDSVLPEVCLDGKRVANSDYAVAASSGSHASQPL